MFLKKVNLLIPILILVSSSSCNKDYYSVGIELYDNQFSDLKSKIFPVFSYQESLDKVQTNNLSLTAAEANKDAAESALSEFSGVSLDDEAAHLLEFQQAYQASARLLQTARELFQSLIDVV